MIDHQPCMNEMARLQQERDELVRYVDRLRDQGALALDYLQALAKHPRRSSAAILADGLRAALAGEIEPQDPDADAAEDAAYAQAVARMEEAEAREDRPIARA